MKLRIMFDYEIEASTPDEEEAVARLDEESQPWRDILQAEFSETVKIDKCLAADIGRIFGSALRDYAELCRRARAIASKEQGK